MASMIVARVAVRPVQASRCSSRPQARQLAFRAPARAILRQSVVAAAAETEAAEQVEQVAAVEEEAAPVEDAAALEGEEVVEEEEEQDAPLGSTFAEKLAKLQAAENNPVGAAEFSLNFLWLDKNIAVAVDQVFGQGQRSPVTEYFFWPRKDAWEELKAALDSRGWIGDREKVLLLNQCTEVINYWQTDNRPSLADARAKFPNSKFQGW
ncbi:hypothetical protein D9Q98_007926 [Chlorella vulgaris]|uniref:30S ribosomal protein 3, chloroplastic n=1 Tax=Chlorella vulgaris TaxID=3077 RepID=A0A9D4YU02_CHLVU|nr:hypothetical protein D9Q98_007926 [Chlorella vulgaris]